MTHSGKKLNVVDSPSLHTTDWAGCGDEDSMQSMRSQIMVGAGVGMWMRDFIQVVEASGGVEDTYMYVCIIGWLVDTRGQYEGEKFPYRNIFAW